MSNRFYLDGGRLIRSLSLVTGLCLTLAGCHHQKIPVLPPIQAQVPLQPPPESSKPVIIEPQPLPPEPPISVKPTPKPRRRKPVPSTPAAPPPGAPAPSTPVASAAAAPPAPLQVASAEPEPPVASVIGSLTAGSDAAPEKHQQATEALGAINKRLAALPQSVLDAQKVQIAQVKNFVRQSEEALRMGDLEGSIQLSTKAKVLLDDLMK